MKIISSANVNAVERLLTPPAGRDRRISAAVAAIVSAVRRRGDAALLAYARRFDRLDGDLEVSPDEIEELAVRVPPKVRAAIATAAKYRDGSHGAEAAGLDITTARRTVEQRVTPLDRVGVTFQRTYPLPLPC